MTERLLLTADWCGACSSVKEILRKRNIKFKEVNVDSKKGKELADKFRIAAIPQMLEKRNGELKVIKRVEDWFS
jgi:glutaredoxin